MHHSLFPILFQHHLHIIPNILPQLAANTLEHTENVPGFPHAHQSPLVFLPIKCCSDRYSFLPKDLFHIKGDAHVSPSSPGTFDDRPKFVLVFHDPLCLPFLGPVILPQFYPLHCLARIQVITNTCRFDIFLLPGLPGNTFCAS